MPNATRLHSPDLQRDPDTNKATAVKGKDQHRTVAGQACKRCRTKKIRCDRTTTSSCTTCIKHEVDCNIDDIPKPKRKSPSTPLNDDAIEQRVKHLECLISTSLRANQGSAGSRHVVVVDPSGPDTAQPLKDDSTPAIDEFPGNTPLETAPWIEVRHGQDISVGTSRSHNVALYPTSNYIGEQSKTNKPATSLWSKEISFHNFTPSSSIHNEAADQHNRSFNLPNLLAELFKPRGVPCFFNNIEPIPNLWSPEGITWMKEKTQECFTQSLLHEVRSSISKTSGTLGLQGSGTSYSLMASSLDSLPSEQETFMLLEQYFQHFNTHHPIFDEEAFMLLVRGHFNGTMSSTPVWLACLHVTLAIGQRCLAMLNPSARSELEEDMAFGLFDCAMKLLPDLLLATPSLLSIQALLAMTIFLQTTENSTTAFSLIAVTTRQLRQIDISTDQESRRIYALAYIIETDVMTQTSSIDFETELESSPNLSPIFDGISQQKWWSSGDETRLGTLFSFRLKLALVQRKVQKSVSSLASQQSDITCILRAVEALDRELEAWKDAIPDEWQLPLTQTRNLTSCMAPIIQLHIIYYSTALALHHASITLAYMLSTFSVEVREGFMSGSGPLQIGRSMDACLTEARSTITAMQNIPNSRGGNALNCINLRYGLSAFATLFANILFYPTATSTALDLSLLNSIVSLVSTIETACTRRRRRMNVHLLGVCKIQEAMAIYAVQTLN